MMKSLDKRSLITKKTSRTLKGSNIDLKKNLKPLNYRERKRIVQYEKRIKFGTFKYYDLFVEIKYYEFNSAYNDE